MTSCKHKAAINEVRPSARGCEECLKIGSPWVHLRLCRTCGHVGCCDDSPIGMRRRISMPPATRSSRAMIRRRDGAGAMWTRWRSICLTRRPNGGRSRIRLTERPAEAGQSGAGLYAACCFTCRATNASRSALTRSFSVVHMPCGAPLYTLNSRS